MDATVFFGQIGKFGGYQRPDCVVPGLGRDVRVKGFYGCLQAFLE